jgi:hypothetical protein
MHGCLSKPFFVSLMLNILMEDQILCQIRRELRFSGFSYRQHEKYGAALYEITAILAGIWRI